MQTKLHINISQGVVDVEGDPEFVREVYADFKDRLLDGLNNTPGNPMPNGSSVETNKSSPKRKKRSLAKKAAQTDSNDSGIDPRNPKLDKGLDLSRLCDFYDQFEPKNNSEKILIFAKFLIDELDIDQPNTDQFYSCFSELREVIPTAFSQAFWAAHGRNYGYIGFKSATDISVTTKGTNYFNNSIKRKDAE